MADSLGTKVAITEDVTKISVSNTNSVGVTLAEETTTVSVNNYAVPSSYQDSVNTVFSPYGTITASNVSDALKQLADQDFRSTTTPSGTNVSEGDTWYDINNNVIKVYREISSGVFAWTNLIVAETNDSLDAGAF